MGSKRRSHSAALEPKVALSEACGDNPSAAFAAHNEAELNQIQGWRRKLVENPEHLKQCFRGLIPNLLTLSSTLSALAGLFLVYEYHDVRAVSLLLLAGFFDAVDGPIARKLNAQSRFGNLYDSMSDLVSFGVVPALMLVRLELLHPWVAIAYIVAIQFRLTRYSAMGATELAAAGNYFNGLSAPDAVYTGVLLGMLPFVGMNLGFLLVGLAAIYPRRLMPKGFRVCKLAAAALILLYFLFFYYPSV